MKTKKNNSKKKQKKHTRPHPHISLLAIHSSIPRHRKEHSNRPLLQAKEAAGLSDVDNVINLHYAAHSLGSQGDGAGGHEQWLDDILLQNISDCALEKDGE